MDPILLQAQNDCVYLDFLRSDMEQHVVQIDMDLEHRGHALYAIPDAGEKSA